MRRLSGGPNGGILEAFMHKRPLNEGRNFVLRKLSASWKRRYLVLDEVSITWKAGATTDQKTLGRLQLDAGALCMPADDLDRRFCFVVKAAEGSVDPSAVSTQVHEA